MRQILAARANQQCELCRSNKNLAPYLVGPKQGQEASDYIYACAQCRQQLNEPSTMDANHWRCLNDSMWNEVPAVQVVVYRVLLQLKHEGWPAELLEMLYLHNDTKNWALAGLADNKASHHQDSNGISLTEGNSISLIKDLKVKGANFTAKRGTKVKNIRLVADNTSQIEGRIEGQNIVILTQFIKKV